MRSKFMGKLAVFLAASGFAFGSFAVAAQPKVVASIAPLHSLVTGVMEGVGSPTLLVKGGASPHTYAMKPSDARALENADVIVWIGEDLERFLAKPVGALGGTARSLEVLSAPGVHLLYPGDRDDPAEAAEHKHANKPEHESERADSHGDGHGHDANSADPHIWLSPENARAIVAATVGALEAADPANAARYRANGERLTGRIDRLAAEIRQILAPVAKSKFVVFHDAYRYFEQAFGIRHVGAITVNPERMPGARHLSDLRQQVIGLGATCVFREPQFTPKLAEAIISGTPARLGVLDPLGADLESGPDLYFRLMHGNARAIADCLSGKTAG